MRILGRAILWQAQYDSKLTLISNRSHFYFHFLSSPQHVLLTVVDTDFIFPVSGPMIISFLL